MKAILKRKEASGAIGYVVMFTVALLLVVLTLYLAQVAKLMTHQHHIDDSLADSVLASLVADDVYFFQTEELTGTPVIRFRDVDDSHKIFMDCMNDAILETDGFYYNFAFDDFICYEVEGSNVKITSYSGAAGTRSVRNGRIGSVSTPDGEIVRETSAYGRVKFDIKNIIDDSLLTKSKDIYCTLEINN